MTLFKQSAPAPGTRYPSQMDTSCGPPTVGKLSILSGEYALRQRSVGTSRFPVRRHVPPTLSRGTFRCSKTSQLALFVLLKVNWISVSTPWIYRSAVGRLNSDTRGDNHAATEETPVTNAPTPAPSYLHRTQHACLCGVLTSRLSRSLQPNTTLNILVPSSSNWFHWKTSPSCPSASPCRPVLLREYLIPLTLFGHGSS